MRSQECAAGIRHGSRCGGGGDGPEGQGPLSAVCGAETHEVVLADRDGRRRLGGVRAPALRDRSDA
eukprot:5744179-Prymnesium_polylepis.1